MAKELLTDKVAIYNALPTQTIGIEVVVPLSKLIEVSALVQANASVGGSTTTDGLTQTDWSVKVPRETDIHVGQVIEVLSCKLEPELIGKKLLIKTVSHNGWALIKKCTANDWQHYNPQGNV